METLRHLLFVYDAWFGRAVLGEAAPYHPLGLPASFIDARASSGWTRTCGPTSTRCSPPGKARQDQVRAHLADAGRRGADPRRSRRHGVDGFPPEEERSTLDCLRVILNEEWAHHGFAVRDLDVLDPPRSWASSGSANRQNTWPDGSNITRTSSCGWCAASVAPASSANATPSSRSGTPMSRWISICCSPGTGGQTGGAKWGSYWNSSLRSASSDLTFAQGSSPGPSPSRSTIGQPRKRS